MTSSLGSDPFASLTSQFGIGNSSTFNPDDWLASVDQPTIPPQPAAGVSTRNEPNTVVAPPGAAATGGAIGTAIDAAMKFLGRPYQWGGNGQNGNSVDCSGLIYAAFKSAGFNVQRYRAVDYGHMGTPVDPGDARPGDIVYFDEPGDTDHVGIYLGNGKYIQAPHTGDVVKISTFNAGGGGQIRRIFPEGDFKGLPTTATGNFVTNTADGQRFVAEGKGALNDPVDQVMSALGTNSDPNALIQGLDAKGQLDQMLSQGAGRGVAPPAADPSRFTVQPSSGGGHGGITVGQATGLSQSEAYIIDHESDGRTSADNPTSTAFGFGQLLAANRKAYGARFGFSPDTQDPGQQLTMFRAYIKDRYGTAENAEQFWREHHWY